MPAKQSHRPRGTGCLFKRREKGVWIARWLDSSGKRREKSTRTTDRAAAERILAKHVADAALRRDGVIDTRTDAYAAAERQPLTSHLDDFRAVLRARGNTPNYVNMTLERIRALTDALGCKKLSDLAPSKVQAALGDLHGEGKSLYTCQHYLRAIKGFSRWLHRDGRIREDTLQHLSGFNVETDRQYERRALTNDEAAWLVSATETSPHEFRRLTGRDRAMLYRVAMGTGLRASELASLTPAGFDLDGEHPAVVVPAGSSKRRREDRQPIRDDLAAMLVAYLAGRPTGRVWSGTWNEKAAAMLRRDLRRARARYIKGAHDRAERRVRRSSRVLGETDVQGRRVDFHALRVTYITNLVKSGVPVKVAQELARHSTPELTLNVYSKLGIHDLSAAVDKLPSFTSEPPERERLKATGTCDESPTSYHDISDASNRPASCASVHRNYKKSETEPAETSSVSPCKNRSKRTSVHRNKDAMRSDASSASPGTRTPNPRIKSPLLCQLS